MGAWRACAAGHATVHTLWAVRIWRSTTHVAAMCAGIASLVGYLQFVQLRRAGTCWHSGGIASKGATPQCHGRCGWVPARPRLLRAGLHAAQRQPARPRGLCEVEDAVELRSLVLGRVGRCRPGRPKRRACHRLLHGDREHSPPAPRPGRGGCGTHHGRRALSADANKVANQLLCSSVPPSPDFGPQNEELLRPSSTQLGVRSVLASLSDPQGSSVMRRCARLREARACQWRNEGRIATQGPAERRRAVDHPGGGDRLQGRPAQWCVRVVAGGPPAPRGRLPPGPRAPMLVLGFSPCGPHGHANAWSP